VRLFVAVEVPDGVRQQVAAIERPAGDDVRWADPSAWHVTLRFIGEVPPDDGLDGCTAALGRVSASPTVAVVGRVVHRVGPTALALRVGGLEPVAAAVAHAFAELPGDERRPFAGHLTLGRLRRPGRWPAHGAGSLPEEVRWTVDEVVLVESHLGGGPARYEVRARQRLDPGGSSLW
jgi:2'-5' RNA ligase